MGIHLAPKGFILVGVIINALLFIVANSLAVYHAIHHHDMIFLSIVLLLVVIAVAVGVRFLLLVRNAEPGQRSVPKHGRNPAGGQGVGRAI